MSRRNSRWLSLVSSAFWQQKLAAWRAARFDARHGIETSAVVEVAEMTDIDQSLARHAIHYEASTLPKFERALHALAIDYPRFTFIDYGSGKGRVLLLAAQQPFRAVVGVEMSSALDQAAAQNIDAYLARRPLAAPISRVCGDARMLAVPDGDLVAYFYNPFDESLMREVWNDLRAACMAKPRSLIVMYVNPAHRLVFDQAPELRCVYDDSAVVVYSNH